MVSIQSNEALDIPNFIAPFYEFDKYIQLSYNKSLIIHNNRIYFSSDLNQFKYEQTTISPVLDVVWSSNSNSFSVLYTDYSVSVFNISLNDNYTFQRIIEQGTTVTKLFWSECGNYLYVITIDGTVFIWNMKNNNQLSKKYDELVDVEVMDFDYFTKSLIFIKNSIVYRIPFLSSNKSIAFSSSSIYDISTQKLISNANNFYPIINSIKYDDIAVAKSPLKLIITYPNSFKTYDIPNISFFSKMKNCIFVSTDNSIYIINPENDKISNYPISSPITTLDSNDERAVTVSGNSITVYDFGKRIKKPPRTECTIINAEWDNASMVASTFSFKRTVSNAVVTSSGAVFVLFSNGTVIDLSTSKTILNDVISIFSSPDIDILFAQTRTDLKMIFNHRIESLPYSIISVSSNHLIVVEESPIGGAFPFKAIDYAFPFLTSCISKTDVAVSFLKSIEKSEFFESLCKQTIAFSIQTGQILRMSPILESLSGDSQRTIINSLEPHQQSALVRSGFDVSHCFPVLSEQAKIDFLKSGRPHIFAKVVWQYARSVRKLNVSPLLSELAVGRQWSRVARIAHTTAQQLAPLLESGSSATTRLSRCMSELEAEVVEWSIPDEKEYLIMLGCSFVNANRPVWALSCFVAAHDFDRSKALIGDSTSLQLMASDYTQCHKKGLGEFLSLVLEQD